jgi:hypothetical protein
LGLRRPGTTSTLLDLPLERVSDAHVNRPRLRIRFLDASRLRFQTRRGEVDFVVDHPEIWRPFFVDAKRKMDPTPHPATVAVHVNLPPPPPTPAIHVRSRYGGTPYDEHLGRCPRCGASP